MNTTISKEQYIIADPILYSAAISRFNPKEDASLPPVAGKPGIYSTQFRAPDWHGVVKFVVDYKCEGWMHFHHSITVAVVPPRHDGYLHFLGAAWPYSTSVWFLFSAMWRAGDVRQLKKSNAQRTE
ncbi:hypothetical protein EDD85DRAFT_958791 [Armillaria nabsnona]|nr:hypothetical protein EDD85DRAFT_958791 [Armillaria nabsnona]